MVTVTTGVFSPDVQARLKHLSDVALHVQAASDDSPIVRLAAEPQSCCGLLRLSKFSLPSFLTLPVTEPMLLMVCSFALTATNALDGFMYASLQGSD